MTQREWAQASRQAVRSGPTCHLVSTDELIRTGSDFVGRHLTEALLRWEEFEADAGVECLGEAHDRGRGRRDQSSFDPADVSLGHARAGGELLLLQPTLTSSLGEHRSDRVGLVKDPHRGDTGRAEPCPALGVVLCECLCHHGTSFFGVFLVVQGRTFIHPGQDVAGHVLWEAPLAFCG